MTQKPNAQLLDLVLGGGGIKGFAHIGVLRAIEEREVSIGKVIGVSVGALVASLYTNGFSPSAIEEVFFERLPQNFVPTEWLRTLVPQRGKPTTAIFGNIFDLQPSMAEFVTAQELEPQKDLAIVCYDLVSNKPHVFQNSDYDLAEALAASCALPGLFRPCRQKGRLLVDGSLYQRAPTEFCKQKAIVSRLGDSHKLPASLLCPVDMNMCMRELHIGLPQENESKDGEHILVDISSFDGGCLTICEPTLQRLVDYGYRTALAAIDAAAVSGRLT